MKEKEYPENKHVKSLRKLAMALPEATEGPSCNNRAFSAGKKNFLFVGMKEDHYIVRLKVKDSLPDLQKLGKKDSQTYDVSTMGWVKITYSNDEAPVDSMSDWVTESYRLLTPKSLSSQLDGGSAPKKKAVKKKPASAKKKSVKKKAVKKRAVKKKAAKRRK